MSRTVIVRTPSRVMDDPSTRVLFRYANGERLVETDAPEVESARPQDAELAVTAGVAVDAPQHLDDARASLDATPGGTRLAAYVELRGPADAGLLAALRAQGVQPGMFRPLHTYLCTGTATAFRAVRELPFVAEVTPVVAALKPRAATSEDGRSTTDVDVVAAVGLTDGEALRAAVAAIPGATVAGPPETTPTLVRLPAKLTSAGQAAVLALPGVIAVEPRAPRRAEDEVADLILVGSCDGDGRPSGSYVSWLDDHGLNGAGVTIGIVDQGVDVDHPAFDGRITDLTGGSKDWHGTFVAGHAAGSYMDESDDDGFVYGIGMAPSAELLAQDNQHDATALCEETVSSSGPSGINGSIQSNSWGAGTSSPMDYRSQEAAYDALVRNAAPVSGEGTPLTICFSSGNDGAKGLTRPKAAKNLIVTGNSESYRPSVGGTDADDVREVYTGAHASSHGNCADGRIRPHVVAPGEWTASANYDSHPGEKEYVTDRITWGGGSSGACPKTAGACALLTQWWRDHDGGTSPSPAMLRALVVNGAEPIDSGGPVPNPLQGWGRLNVEAIVSDDVHRTLLDQTTLLTERGDARSWTIRPTDPSRPLYITLAWTDPPGSPGTGTATTPAIVNQLALRAETFGQLFRGNQFESGWSTPDQGSEREGWDNTQCIHLRPEDMGDTVEVTVTALELAMDCLTNTADTPQQDFALVVRGGYVDQGFCPADVVLVIDDGAASDPVEDEEEDHWTPGSSDEEEVGDPVEDSTDEEPTDDEDPWWEDGDDDSPDEETSRPPRPVPAAVRAGAAAGLEVARDGRNAVPAADATAPVADLGAALARIDAGWAEHDGGRRRAAVLVVGDATRVSNADVAALRRLAFRGELWVLSTTASILRFLSQRVHRRTGVHYRLFEDAGDLARGVRDALAEAAGLQQLVTRTQPLPGGAGSTVTFDVVPADREVVVRVEGLPGAGATVALRDGSGRPEVALDPAAPPAGVTVERSGAGLEARVPVTAKRAGAWALTIRTPAGARRPAVDVYARSGLALTPAVRPTGGAPLAAVRGGAGVGISRLRFSPPRVPGAVGGPAVEDERDIEVVARPSRAGNGDGPTTETTRATVVPSLGTVVKAPEVRRGARVVDLHGAAHGTLADGHAFGRVVRPSLVELEPRSRWRSRIGPRPVVLTGATVASVEREDERVTALTLRRAGRVRRVVVRDPQLGTLLASIELEGREMLFRVRGDVLLGVVRPMGGGPLPIVEAGSNGNGTGHGLVSLAGLEPVLPVSEDTKAAADYAGASRFVAAKYFQAKPAGRTIDQVVIHITDGGARVDGTVAWFKAPRKPDGSELKVSAHYVIGQDGEIVQMVAERDVAYHANSANGRSIGIEHCARSVGALGASDKGLKPTEAQYEASAALVRDICTRLGIPIDRVHVLGHNEADTTTTHKGCPTNAWDWEHYMTLLEPPPDDGPADPPEDDDPPDDDGPVDGPTDDGEEEPTDDEPTDDWEEPTDDTEEEPTDDTEEEPTDDWEEPADDTEEEPTDDWEEPTDDTEEEPADDTEEEPTDDWEEPTDDTEEEPTDDWEEPTDDTEEEPTDDWEEPIEEAARDRLVAVDKVSLMARDEGPPIVRRRDVIEDIDIEPIRNRRYLRPKIFHGPIPYLPTSPAPQLGEPIPAGEFVLWPDAPRGQVFFALTVPRLRSVALVVNRERVDVAGGGSTVKVTGANAVLTASAYYDGDPITLEALRLGWIAALVSRGMPAAAGWRFEPLSLKGISGALGLRDGDLAGEVTVAGAPDAGTVTYSVPLSEAGALAWLEAFEAGEATRLAGTCSMAATYVATLGDTVDVRERPLAVDLGTLLAPAGPRHVTVVDPQITVATRVIVTAQELVDSVTVDLSPSEGAAATSLAFTSEGGQTTLPVTSQHIEAVTIPYTATVRFTPSGWPVIRQTGTLDFARADWSLWVKPDSWVVPYDVFVTLLDEHNHVIPAGSEPAGDVLTLRFDYRHPGLPEPLSLTLQVASQQLIRVPFPDPPGSVAPPAVTLTVIGTRGTHTTGPLVRKLGTEETMVVLRSYANGAVDLTTNRDRVSESSPESEALGLLARVH